MLPEIGNWFSTNVEVIMTAIGFGGAGVASLSGVWLFLDKVKGSILGVFDNDTKKLNTRIDTLEEQNQILMDYVKTSAQAKLESPLISDEARSKFQDLTVRASEFTSSKFNQVVEELKDKISF